VIKLKSVLSVATELGLQMFGCGFALESAGCAFGEEAFLVYVYEGGRVTVLEVGLKSMPSFDVGVACVDRAVHVEMVVWGGQKINGS